MDGSTVKVGDEVSLGGYPDSWLLIELVEGSRLRVCHTFGSPRRHSAGFWIDLAAVLDQRPAASH